MIQTGLLVLSAALLGDALRMLGAQFRLDPRLKINQKTMGLHVFALFFHTGTMVFFAVANVLRIQHLGADNYKTYNNMWQWSRLAMYISGVVSEVIVIYLFLDFAAPVSLKKQVKEDSDEDYEEEYDRIRDPNADMMYFVKQSNRQKGKPGISMKTRTVSLEVDRTVSAAEALFRSEDEPLF